MTKESLDDQVETSWKKVGASAAASAASTAHSALCPVHGVIPGVAKAAGTTAVLSEYQILKPFAYIHESQMEYTSEALETLPMNDAYHGRHLKEKPGHVGHSHDDLHPYTEPVVSGSNLLLMAVSVGYLTHSIYDALNGKEHEEPS